MKRFSIIKIYFPISFGNNAFSKISKEELQKLLKNIDLLVVDIDDTIAPHFTVGIANKIFLDYFFKCLFNKQYSGIGKIETTKNSLKIISRYFLKRRLKLSNQWENWRVLTSLTLAGIKLHLLRFIRNTNNSLGLERISNEILIKTFLSSVKKNKINFQQYNYTKKELRNSLYPGAKEFFKNLRKISPKLRILCISQSFSHKASFVKEYSSLLRPNSFFSNILDLNNNGRIISSKLIVPNSKIKRKIVEDIIKKYNSKNIGVLANEFEDRDIIKMREISLCILNKAPFPLWKDCNILLNSDYRGLL